MKCDYVQRSQNAAIEAHRNVLHSVSQKISSTVPETRSWTTGKKNPEGRLVKLRIRPQALAQRLEKYRKRDKPFGLSGNIRGTGVGGQLGGGTFIRDRYRSPVFENTTTHSDDVSSPDIVASAVQALRPPQQRPTFDVSGFGRAVERFKASAQQSDARTSHSPSLSTRSSRKSADRVVALSGQARIFPRSQSGTPARIPFTNPFKPQGEQSSIVPGTASRPGSMGPPPLPMKTRTSMPRRMATKTSTPASTPLRITTSTPSQSHVPSPTVARPTRSLIAVLPLGNPLRLNLTLGDSFADQPPTQDNAHPPQSDSMTLDQRHEAAVTAAQLSAQQTLNWELTGAVAESRGLMDRRPMLALERLGNGLPMSCYCDRGKVRRRCKKSCANKIG